jgi:hypothetical protein
MRTRAPILIRRTHSSISCQLPKKSPLQSLRVGCGAHTFRDSCATPMQQVPTPMTRWAMTTIGALPPYQSPSNSITIGSSGLGNFQQMPGSSTSAVGESARPPGPCVISPPAQSGPLVMSTPALCDESVATSADNNIVYMAEQLIAELQGGPALKKRPASASASGEKPAKQRKGAIAKATDELVFPGRPSKLVPPREVHGKVIYTDIASGCWRIKLADGSVKCACWATSAKKAWEKVCNLVK